MVGALGPPAQALFAVQAEVPDKVAASLAGSGGSNIGAIQSRLLTEAKQRAPADLSAYDFNMLAREQRKLGTKAGILKGLEYVDKAIALDPNYAPAYASRAWLKIAKGDLFDVPHVTNMREVESDLQTALALDPSNADAQAGLMLFLSLDGRFAEASAVIDRALRDNPTNNLVLASAANQLPYLGRPEEGVAMADLVFRLDPQTPMPRRNMLVFPYFFDRKFQRVIEISDQIPDEHRTKMIRLMRAASYALLERTEDAERARAELIAKNGEQVMEMWFNDGEVFVRTKEEDIYREAFRKLGFRICATEEELKKFDNPKRLPECVKT